MKEIEVKQPIVTQTEGILTRGNSQASKPKDIPTVTGDTVIPAPTFGQKLKSAFFVKEDFKSIGDYVLFDILIPNIRRSMFDAVVGTASQIFGQPLGSRPRPGNGYNGGDGRYVDYTTHQRFTPQKPKEREFTRKNISEIEFHTEDQAMEALSTLSDVANGRTNQCATVYEFFHIAKVPEDQNPYTNWDYGWTANTIDSEGSVRHNRANGLYFVTLPIARPVNNPRGVR